MKLSYIPNTLIQLLRPRVIRTNDTLPTALERKKDTLSFQSAEKLVRIANADVTCGADLRLGSHFRELSHLEAGGDTAFCVRAADMPLSSAAFAVEKVLNAADVHLDASARPSLERHLTTFLKDVEVTQSRWTDLYWEHYNPDVAADDQSGISGRAVKCLGTAPDPSTQKNDLPSDTRMLDIFKRMAGTQEAKLPPQALDVLDAAFVRLHSVNAIEDPAAYASSMCLAIDLHTYDDFVSFPDTQHTLQEIRQWVETVNKADVKGQLLAKLDRFDARVNAGVTYCMLARQEALGGDSNDETTRKRLEKFDTWLGELKDRAVQNVDLESAAQVSELSGQTAAEPINLQQPQVLSRSSSLISFNSYSSIGSEPQAFSGRVDKT